MQRGDMPGADTVVAGYHTTAGEVRSWRAKREPGRPPGHANTNVEMAPADAPMTVCILDGSFRASNGPYTRAIYELDHTGAVELDVAGNADQIAADGSIGGGVGVR
jgi:hypothetical protein